MFESNCKLSSREFDQRINSYWRKFKSICIVDIQIGMNISPSFPLWDFKHYNLYRMMEYMFLSTSSVFDKKHCLLFCIWICCCLSFEILWAAYQMTKSSFLKNLRRQYQVEIFVWSGFCWNLVHITVCTVFDWLKKSVQISDVCLWYTKEIL